MSNPILDLTNGDNWEPVWAYSATSEPVPGRPGYTFPIDPIECPIVFDRHIIAIAINSPSAKPGRRYAGKAVRQIVTGLTVGANFDATISDRRSLFLRQINVCQFQRLTPTYGLIFEPYWRLDDLEIQIFKYTGIESDETSETLLRIEDGIEQLIVNTTP